METKDLKTDYQNATEERDALLYADFVALHAQGVPIGKINNHLMKKYALYSPATVWQIRKRVEKRIAERGQA